VLEAGREALQQETAPGRAIPFPHDVLVSPNVLHPHGQSQQSLPLLRGEVGDALQLSDEGVGRGVVC
jgi:hypothetical protein